MSDRSTRRAGNRPGRPLRTGHPRRGYAMLVVLVMLAVGLVFISVNQRRISAVLRIERARAEAVDFEEGPALVMSQALELMESGLPPADPYVCLASVTTAQGPRSFRVTMASLGGGQWTVDVEPAPAAGLPPMPTTFAPP